MIFRALLQFLLLLQGAVVLPSQNGTITGVLRSESSRPAAGVRVSVLAPPENPADVANVASLVSIAETDENGRFRLESIPPGRYYITAGRVEQPTYYPGTLEIRSGRIVTVGASETVSGVDFTLKDSSDRGIETVNAMLRIPVVLHLENDLRIPVFSERGRVRLRLTHVSDGNRTEVALNADTLTLPIAAGDYRVDIANLPADYTLTALHFGAIDLLRDALKITQDDLPKPQPGEQMFMTDTLTGIVLQRRVQSSGTYVQPSPQFVQLGSLTSRTELTLSIVVSPRSASAAAGVRIRGRVDTLGQQEVYISGTPGTLYADGSFEFRAVPPGRHVVAMLGGTASSRQFGGVVTVGNSDIENLTLLETISLPLDVLMPRTSPAALAASSPLHTFRGHVADESGRPVAGIVTFLGYSRSTTYSLPADGEFEIPNLLPGSYGLRIETFDRSSLTRTVEVENEDVDLKLTAVRDKNP